MTSGFPSSSFPIPSYAEDISDDLSVRTSNHLAKRAIWDKSPELTSWNFGNRPSVARVISKVQDVNKGDLSKIARFARWLLVNRMSNKVK